MKKDYIFRILAVLGLMLSLLTLALQAGAQADVSTFKMNVDASIINQTAVGSVTRAAVGGRFKDLADIVVGRTDTTNRVATRSWSNSTFFKTADTAGMMQQVRAFITRVDSLRGALTDDSLKRHYTKTEIDTFLANLRRETGAADSGIINYLIEYGNTYWGGGGGGGLTDTPTLDDVAKKSNLSSQGIIILPLPGFFDDTLFLGHTSPDDFFNAVRIGNGSRTAFDYFGFSGAQFNLYGPVGGGYTSLTGPSLGDGVVHNVTVPGSSGTMALTSDVIGAFRRSPTSGDSIQVFQFNAWRNAFKDSAGAGGTVTNVRLTMPSAFSVTGSPITTMGTLSVTANGTAAQYITGTGALATFAHTHTIADITGLPDTLLNMWSAIAAASGGSSVWSTDANGAFYAGNVGIGKGSNASYRLDLKTNGSDLALRVNSDGAPYPTGGVFASGRNALFVSNSTLSGLTFLNYNKSAGSVIGLDFGTDTAGNGNVVADAGFKFHTDYRGLEFTSVNTTGSNPAIKFTTLSRAFDFYGGFLDKHLLYVDATNGRTGINTSTPGYDLDVAGSFRAGGASNGLLYDNPSGRLYLTTTGSTPFQIEKANVGLSNWINMKDGTTGGYMSFGSTGSNFLPTISFSPGSSANQQSSFLVYSSDPSTSSAAFRLDSRTTSGRLVNQPVFQVGSWSDTYFTVQAGGSILYSSVASTPPDPPAGSAVQWFDGTNMKWKKNVGGTVTSGTLY